MTRHSNMMIFGTNTVVGVRAGVNASSVPEVAVGFTRQEAVILPLVANTGSSHSKDGSEHLLTPCDMSKPLLAPRSGDDTRPFRVHPCSLVAVNDKAQDSYSVLSSFGGNFDATSETGKPAAKAGVSQYFATGMAAQLLALKGGAASVATGEAANSSAQTPIDQSAVRSLFGGKGVAYSTAVVAGRAYRPFEKELMAKIDAGSDDSVGPSVLAFERDAKIDTGLATACTSKANCKRVASGAYLNDYLDHADDMESALKNWK
jgi:hypothetical protein